LYFSSSFLQLPMVNAVSSTKKIETGNKENLHFIRND
jgi:hypothetical protein